MMMRWCRVILAGVGPAGVGLVSGCPEGRRIRKNSGWILNVYAPKPVREMRK